MYIHCICTLQNQVHHLRVKLKFSVVIKYYARCNYAGQSSKLVQAYSYMQIYTFLTCVYGFSAEFVNMHICVDIKIGLPLD